MEKLCCISVTLGARFIAAFDLSTSILAINFIAREFFIDQPRLIAFDDIQIFLGLGWANTSTDSRQRVNYEWILVCLMVYSIVHLICSAVLILATIFRKKNYATPWLTFEVINLASQASGICVQIFQHRCNDATALNGPAYVPMASLYLFLGMYFWLVVFAAQKSWPTETSDVSLDSKKSVLEKSHAVYLNSPKTQSQILSGNRSIFDSPEPPVSAKYYEL